MPSIDVSGYVFKWFQDRYNKPDPYRIRPDEEYWEGSRRMSKAIETVLMNYIAQQELEEQMRNEKNV